MLPTFSSGDRLVVRYRAAPRPGAVVVARFADGMLVVKRAVERREGGWWLLGDNPAGVDSRHRGVVADDDVLAVAALRLRPRPRLLRNGARPGRPGRLGRPGPASR